MPAVAPRYSLWAGTFHNSPARARGIAVMNVVLVARGEKLGFGEGCATTRQHLLDAIKSAANSRDVPFQSLIKVWLQEKLRSY